MTSIALMASFETPSFEGVEVVICPVDDVGELCPFLIHKHHYP